MNTDYDVIIVGGGMVGASLACALSAQNLRIALVEAHALNDQSQPSYDDRAIALSYGTQRILHTMGVWPHLEQEATPILHIHVSDKGHFGAARIHHDEENVPALGYVTAARVLGQALYQFLNRHSNIELICFVASQGFALDNKLARLTISRDGIEQCLNARLIVAADGGNSSVRNALKIPFKQIDYGQSAIISNVTIDKAHDNIAYERFTDNGPLALLPMKDRHCSLVWTRRNENVRQILELDDAQFLQSLQQHFGYRLGKFIKTGKRDCYPLRLVYAKRQVQARLALIGNAAHTLHPIAGQGFNLGMRDVAALAQTVTDAHRQNQDIGALEVLTPYQQWRERDQQRTIGLTDKLVRVFSNRFPPLSVARNIGLLALDLTPVLKSALARHTMGLAQRQPRLARGLPV